MSALDLGAACLVIVLALGQLWLLWRGQPARRSQVAVLCVALVVSNVGLIGWIIPHLTR
jgi:hypothetical protein